MYIPQIFLILFQETLHAQTFSKLTSVVSLNYQSVKWEVILIMLMDVTCHIFASASCFFLLQIKRELRFLLWTLLLDSAYVHTEYNTVI